MEKSLISTLGENNEIIEHHGSQPVQRREAANQGGQATPTPTATPSSSNDIAEPKVKCPMRPPYFIEKKKTFIFPEFPQDEDWKTEPKRNRKRKMTCCSGCQETGHKRRGNGDRDRDNRRRQNL